MLKILICIAITLVIFYCLLGQNESKIPEKIPALPEISLEPLQLPVKRNFKLGFTYQPHAWSEEAFKEAYSFAEKNGDLISIYIDEGVPWEESYYEKPFPEIFQRELEKRVEGSKNQSVVLTLNVLGVDRKSLANNWTGEDSLSFNKPKLPGIFKGKRFNSPEIIEAYFRYCSRVIEMFKPEYFFYAGESNWNFEGVNTNEFKGFLQFSKEIYGKLKAKYPNLPISQEFVLASPEKMVNKWDMTAALLEYSDLFGVSSYPYVVDASETKGDASKLSQEWFSQVSKRFSDKPITILETGFNAKGFSYWGNVIQGNESSQDYYLRFLLIEAQRHNFEFVVWWVYRDYDELWKLMEANGVDEAFSQWRSTGVLDGLGNERASYQTWKAWHSLPFDE